MPHGVSASVYGISHWEIKLIFQGGLVRADIDSILDRMKSLMSTDATLKSIIANKASQLIVGEIKGPLS